MLGNVRNALFSHDIPRESLMVYILSKKIKVFTSNLMLFFKCIEYQKNKKKQNKTKQKKKQKKKNIYRYLCWFAKKISSDRNIDF